MSQSQNKNQETEQTDESQIPPEVRQEMREIAKEESQQVVSESLESRVEDIVGRMDIVTGSDLEETRESVSEEISRLRDDVNGVRDSTHEMIADTPTHDQMVRQIMGAVEHIFDPDPDCDDETHQEIRKKAREFIDDRIEESSVELEEPTEDHLADIESPWGPESD